MYFFVCMIKVDVALILPSGVLKLSALSIDEKTT
jgi:hypothetical protein